MYLDSTTCLQRNGLIFRNASERIFSSAGSGQLDSNLDITKIHLLVIAMITSTHKTKNNNGIHQENVQKIGKDHRIIRAHWKNPKPKLTRSCQSSMRDFWQGNPRHLLIC